LFIGSLLVGLVGSENSVYRYHYDITFEVFQIKKSKPKERFKEKRQNDRTVVGKKKDALDMSFFA